MDFDSISCEVINNQLTVFCNGKQVPINQRQLMCILVKGIKHLNSKLPEMLKIREIEVTEEEPVEIIEDLDMLNRCHILTTRNIALEKRASSVEARLLAVETRLNL